MNEIMILYEILYYKHTRNDYSLMPVPVDDWSHALGEDSFPLIEEINEFLDLNKDEAFSAAEIACQLAEHYDIEGHAEGVKDPSRPVGELSVQELGGLSSQAAHVKAILDMLDWGENSLKVGRVDGIDYYQHEENSTL